MTHKEPLSPLGAQLASLIETGLVSSNPYPLNDFPSAMLVMPVFDSTSTRNPNMAQQEVFYAELARHSR
ncbi:hypothetical protein [Paracoccus tibetensis]|uniref:Uncharacterized protein n=1 Tax=Paracoccus tibetensis TaxID=336292 RepID=A0A1G5BH01_9RHOB|nr:hypothetical protein [Paracoccus tibetensis]SCX89401.1 hypothetical protein SAMN05660710_00141 [Paracoccus tibetensis]